MLAAYSLTMFDGNVTLLLQHITLASAAPRAALDLTFAAALWFLAPAIARRLTSAPEPAQRLAMDVRALLAVGTAALGLVLCVQALDVAAHVLCRFPGTGLRNLPPFWIAAVRAMFTLAALQFVGGLALFLGRNGLRQVFAAVRSY